MMTSICQTDSCQANVWSIQQCGSSALLQCFLLFSFGSSGYQLGCTIAVVSVQRPVEPVKNALQNIANEGTPRIVIIPRVLFKIGPFLNPYKATSVLCSNLSLSLCVIPDSVYPVRREGGVPGELPERLHEPLPVRRVGLRVHQKPDELAVSVLK